MARVTGDVAAGELGAAIRASRMLVVQVLVACLVLFAAWVALVAWAPSLLAARLGGGFTVGLLVYLVVLVVAFALCVGYCRLRRVRVDAVVLRTIEGRSDA